MKKRPQHLRARRPIPQSRLLTCAVAAGTALVTSSRADAEIIYSGSQQWASASGSPLNLGPQSKYFLYSRPLAAPAEAAPLPPLGWSKYGGAYAMMGYGGIGGKPPVQWPDETPAEIREYVTGAVLPPGHIIDETSHFWPLNVPDTEVVQLTTVTPIDGSQPYHLPAYDAKEVIFGLSFSPAGATTGSPSAAPETYYMWMRGSFDGDNLTTIHDWAYESTPGVGIAAGAVPEPSSLGLLALGATGLLALRRKRVAA